MAKLTLNDAQTALFQLIYADLEDAFRFGVDPNGSQGVLELGPSDSYDDDKAMGAAISTGLDAEGMRTLVKTSVARMLAPVIKRMIPVGVTGSVTLAKLTGGGTNGRLTFENGILTSKVDPT